MNVERLPRTSDATHIIITDDSRSQHRFVVWEDRGDDCAKGIALAVEQVKERMAKASKPSGQVD